MAIAKIWSALYQYQVDIWQYPDWQCTSDLKETLWRFIHYIPADPQSKRITYGTKSWGCTNGVYAYAPLNLSYSEKASYVLIANTESEGKKSNFVLPTKNVIFTWTYDEVVSNIWWNNQENIENVRELSTGDIELSKNTSMKIYDSRVVKTLICKNGVYITSGSSLSLCLDGKQDKWYVDVDPKMVYIYTY